MKARVPLQFVFLRVFVFLAVALLTSCSRPPSTIRIGCITPLTGDGAEYGAATRRGVDLAVDKINSSGGINGKPLQVIYEDDQMSPSTATNAIQKLISVDKVPVIIGAFGSSVTLAIAPIAERNKTVLFSASSTADAIRDSGDYIFRNVPTNQGQGKTAAQFALDKLHAKNAAVLHMNNDYGFSLTKSFQANFQAGGGTILAVESYNPGATDFRAQLTKLRALHPDLIFYPGHYQESGLILKQAKELGMDSTFIGGDGSYAPELIKLAGPAAEGSYYTLMAVGYDDPNPAVNSFVDSFKKKFGQAPDVYSGYAYDATLMIAQAIRVAGYSPDGIKHALYDMKSFQGVTGPTSFDANGEVDKPFGIYVVKGGQFVPETNTNVEH